MIDSIKSIALLCMLTASSNAFPASFPKELYDELMLERRADPTPPKALPQKATADQLKFQPAMDFDTDGCYNVPAIDANGNVAQGLKHNYVGAASACHDLSDLQNNNVYVRTRCNTGWCIHLYDYYFEKDVAVQHVIDVGGHVNDWEHIAVWTQNNEIRGVSTSAHGKYSFKAAGQYRTHQDANHAKVIYHKDGGSTHCFRFANEADDRIENHTGQWFYGALIDYYTGFPNEGVRNTLMSHDFGKASIAIKDSSFMDNINKAKPNSGYAPGFNPGADS